MTILKTNLGYLLGQAYCQQLWCIKSTRLIIFIKFEYLRA